MIHRKLSWLLFATFVALVLSGCGEEVAIDADPVFSLDRQAVDEIPFAEEGRTDVIAAPLLRSLLQDLLTEHSDLSILAMRHAVDGEPMEETIQYLTANTDDLTNAIGLVYGPDGAAAFDQLWTNHIEFFNSYATAIRSGDQAGADAIVALGHYEHDFSSFVETATGEILSFEDVLKVLHTHVGQLLEQADAWSAGNYAEAYRLSSEAHFHMDAIAAALADGMRAQEPLAFPGDPATVEAEACAADQLAVSALGAATVDLARAELDGDADAAGTELAALLLIASPEAISVAEQSAPTGSSLAEYTRGRDRGRSLLAESGRCAGLVLGE